MPYFCSFASGSSGNSALYVDGDLRILIDAGTNTKYISGCLAQLDLTPADLTHILITHSHSDHVSALPVLLKRTAAQVVCSEDTYSALSVPLHRAQLFTPDDRLELQGCAVQTFATPHDTPGSCGYVLGENKVAVCTDLGQMTGEIYARLRGCHTVFLESNHDIEMLKNGPYPYYLKQRVLSAHGHMSNTLCAKVVHRLAQDGTRRVILAHLSAQNNTPRLAQSASAAALRYCGAQDTVALTVAPRQGLLPPVTL